MECGVWERVWMQEGVLPRSRSEGGYKVWKGVWVQEEVVSLWQEWRGSRVWKGGWVQKGVLTWGSGFGVRLWEEVWLQLDPAPICKHHPCSSHWWEHGRQEATCLHTLLATGH